jgi:hypothetical protein
MKSREERSHGIGRPLVLENPGRENCTGENENENEKPLPLREPLAGGVLQSLSSSVLRADRRGSWPLLLPMLDMAQGEAVLDAASSCVGWTDSRVGVLPNRDIASWVGK